MTLHRTVLQDTPILIESLPGAVFCGLAQLQALDLGLLRVAVHVVTLTARPGLETSRVGISWGRSHKTLQSLRRQLIFLNY
jgi:hypothetical protein